MALTIKLHNMKKTLLTTLLYIALTVFFYLLISCIGLIWFSWKEIIYSEIYNEIYWVFVGWWIAMPICAEYYNEN